MPRPALSRLVLVGLALALTALSGCIGQGQYDTLSETNRSLTARNAELTRERDEARAQADMIRRNLSGGAGTLAELQRQNLELKRLLDQANQDYRGLEQRIAGLNFGPVDADTDTALTALAAQYPDLIKYDPARGMLRFASDLTFDSGSDAVKDQAKQALGALAQVLSSGAASAYDVVVEGHTDSQRISSNTASRHPTNRHLSAHRSISVISELAAVGVPTQRMMAAGWGEYRPAVTNTPTGNTPQNRRVEIFLVKSAGSLPGAGTNTNALTEPPTRPVDMSK